MKRNVVFVITNGRSGTNWLNYILQQNLKGWSVYHENPPTLNFSDYDGKNWNKKKELIEKTLNDNKGYIETNHMFIKTFWKDVVKDFRDKLKVIVLFREPELIARSLFCLNTIPGESHNARIWYFDPKNEDNLFKIELRDDYDKCLWHPYEVMFRALKFNKDHPSIPIKTVLLSELNTHDGMKDLLSWIEDKQVEDVMLNTTPTNSKATRFKTKAIRDDLLTEFLRKREVMEYEWGKQLAI